MVNIGGKRVAKPGMFFVINEQTPKERLEELKQFYNSQEFEQYTPEWDRKMQAWYKEIMDIVELHPELAPIELKSYTFI